MKLTVLNDIHVGTIRAEGTTATSQWALRVHLIAELKRLLPDEGDCWLNGDLFDTGSIPIYDVFCAFEVLSDWLTKHPDSKLYNVAGNHDLNKTSNILSSFQLLGRLLTRSHRNQYVHIEEAQMTPHGYVIPHVRNQDVFDIELAKVPECKFLFLHCNVDNGFAAQSDQSLNISLEQVQNCKAEYLIVGHEHNSRLLTKVVLPGNQIASSVSDWLNGGDKQFMEIIDGEMNLRLAARKADNYAEVDWKSTEWTDRKFLRIVGNATAEEASSVVTAVNNIRKKSEAFVVSNAVRIQSDDMSEEVAASLEAAQSFDIMKSLKDIMTEEEMKILEALNA